MHAVEKIGSKFARESKTSFTKAMESSDDCVHEKHANVTPKAEPHKKEIANVK